MGEMCILNLHFVYVNHSANLVLKSHFCLLGMSVDILHHLSVILLVLFCRRPLCISEIGLVSVLRVVTIFCFDVVFWLRWFLVFSFKFVVSYLWLNFFYGLWILSYGVKCHFHSKVLRKFSFSSFLFQF